MVDHMLEPPRPVRRLEVITGTGGRRRWSADEKARILEEAMAPGAVVSEVARRNGMSPQHLFTWRRQAKREAGDPPLAFTPVVVAPEPPQPTPAAGREAVDRDCRGGCRHSRPARGRWSDIGPRAARAQEPAMIGPTGTVRVLVATKPVDFRKGADGLAALVRDTMGADPFSGTVYVFRAKRTDRVKLVFWDGTGVVLVAKRLEDGEFRWPKVQDGVIHLSAAQLSALLEGLDWRRVHEARQTIAPSAAS